MSSRVNLYKDEDGVALLTMQDKDQKNTFYDAFVHELLENLEKLAQDPEVKVCVFRGLPDVFCAGAHPDLLQDLVSGRMASTDLLLPAAILDLPIPTIAAMEGHAVGGGLTFALCCETVLMARESRYGCTFMNLGFTPGMGTTRLLQYAFGEYIANEMMFGGQMLKGSHFEGRSLVNYVLPRTEVLPKAMELAARMAEKPRYVLEMLKRQLSLGRRQTFEEARTEENFMHQICFAHPETADLIRQNYTPVPRKNDA